MDSSKKLRRSKDNRMIAGVAAGVAEFFDIDPTLVRIVWVVMVIFAGFGFLLYVIMWIVVPEQGSDDGIQQVADKPSPELKDE